MIDKTSTKTDRKTALLDAAERAARARGYDGFSYADLARDVGIRTASIHYHFPTKADLSAALMRRYHESFEAICADIDANQTTGAGRIRALIERYRIAHDEARSVCLCVAFSINRESLSPDVVAQIGTFRTMMRTWISAAFKLGQADGTVTGSADPKADAAAILALLEGAQLSARAEQDPVHYDNAVHGLEMRLN